MKQLILLFGFLASCMFATGQISQPVKAKEIDASYFLQKSKNQKIAAWLMLGGGAVAASAGLVIALNHIYIWTWDEDYDDGEPEASILFFTGSAAMLGSIPLFIASARNKGRAMRASAGIKMEPITLPVQQGLTRKNYPALTFKLTL
jgi:hypothetical protein